METFRSRLYERTGDAQAALASGRRAIESAEKIGSALTRVIAHACWGTALALTGEWSAARESLELALEIVRADRVGLWMEADYLAILAEIHLGLGDAEQARALSDDAIEIASRMEMRVAEVRSLLARSRVLRALDGVQARDGIEAALDRASELVQATAARSYEPQILLERARLARVLPDEAGHERWLREAHGLFAELGAKGWAEQVAALLA